MTVEAILSPHISEPTGKFVANFCQTHLGGSGGGAGGGVRGRDGGGGGGGARGGENGRDEQERNDRVQKSSAVELRYECRDFSVAPVDIK